MRFDRWLTLSVFQPFCSIGTTSRGNRVPILMYHSVSDDSEGGVHPYYRLTTSPGRFAEHMQWLSDLGYKGVSLEEAFGSPSPKRNGRIPAAITFDDGFRDFYTTAWPILQHNGFTATMYLPTVLIRQQRAVWRSKECLTWDEIRELETRGVQFGSHTMNHPKLSELPWDDIEKEITLSKSCIEQELNKEISAFSYPYAFPEVDQIFLERFQTLLRTSGYKTCVTTQIGCANIGDDPLRLKRLPVNNEDDRVLFAAKLRGGYDWVARPQRAIKSLKAFLRQ